MNENPIVEEVHKIREEMLAHFGGDLHALVKDAQRRTEESAKAGRTVFTPPSALGEAALLPKKVG